MSGVPAKGRVGVTLLVVMLTALGLAAPSFAASPNHPWISETDGVPPNGPRPPTGAFEDACGVARDTSGDLYVSDYYHDTVDVYGPGGSYLTQVSAQSSGNGPCGLAVDAAGHLYVQEWRGDVVRYTPSAYPPTPSTSYQERTLIDPSGVATGIAVNPASNDLFVDDVTYVARFEAPVHAGQTPARIGEGELGEGFGLARSAYAGTVGRLYVPDAASRTVKVFGPSGEPLAAIDGAGTPQAGFVSLADSAVSVDPSDGHVLVADDVEAGRSEYPAFVVDEFNPSGAYRGQIGRWITHPTGEPGVSVEHRLVDPAPPGLMTDAEGRVYITSGNDNGSESGILDTNGNPVEGSLLYTFGPTSSARTLTVTLTGLGNGVVTSTPAGIACGSACSAEYDEGSKVTLTAKPDTHSAFRGWSGACTGTSTCIVTMSAARSVEAEFEALPQRSLEVGVVGAGAVTSEPTGISCPAHCSEDFNEGSAVVLTERPAPHYRFSGWGGVDCSGSVLPTCQVQMTQAKVVSADFEPIPQQELRVSVTGDGSIASATEGIECPSACAGQFDEGETVTLTADPAPHRVVAWEGCDSNPSPNECSVDMTEPRNVSAAFFPIYRMVSVTVNGAGSVRADRGPITGCGAAGGICAGPYPEGADVAFTATAAAGNAFVGWSGGPCSGAGTCLIDVSTSTAITANFAPIPPPVRRGEPGRISIGHVSVRGPKARLKVRVSGPGVVKASGRYLKPKRSHTAAAEGVTVTLALSAAGRRILSARGRLQTQALLAFFPEDGGEAGYAKKSISFRRAR